VTLYAAKVPFKKGRDYSGGPAPAFNRIPSWPGFSPEPKKCRRSYVADVYSNIALSESVAPVHRVKSITGGFPNCQTVFQSRKAVPDRKPPFGAFPGLQEYQWFSNHKKSNVDLIPFHYGFNIKSLIRFDMNSSLS
jgi:hypothetical protein